MLGENKIKYFKDKDLIKNTIITGTNVFLVLLILNLLSLNLLIAEKNIMRITVIFLLLIILFFNLKFKKIVKQIIKDKKINKTLIGVILIILSLLLMVFIDNQLIWFASVPLLLAGLNLTLKGINTNRKELHVLSTTAFSYTIIYLLIQTIPVLWFIVQKFSVIFTSWIGGLIGKPMELGPSVSGLWIIIIFLIFSLNVFLLTGMRKKPIILSRIGLFVVWIFYIIGIGFLEFESNNDVVQYHYVLFLACSVVTYVYLLKNKLEYKNEKTDTAEFNFKKVFKTGIVVALVLLLVSSIVLTSFPGAAKKSDDEQINILFYGHNMLGSWDVPEYGKYGKVSSGMFGLLPYYLNLSCYKSSIVTDNITEFMEINFPEIDQFADYGNLTDTLDANITYLLNQTLEANNTITRFVNITDYATLFESSYITEDVLTDVDVFVVINLNNSFTEQELQNIWNFVENGGGLLVLGDHTNIGHMQQPLNNLTSTVGISYRFDSGLPIDSDFKWVPCYHLMSHPITNRITSLDMIQISVGATLDISPGCNPFIVGRYGLSDWGNTENEAGAFLGDYNYNPGEQIGDIILATSAYYGNGRVVVFGDTSSFQNSAIPLSLPMIHSVFNWLSSSRNSTVENIQIIIAIVLLVGAMVIYWIYNKKGNSYSLFPIVLCIGLLVTVAINPILVGSDQIKGNIVSIDTSHNERFNLDPFNDDSISGTIINLMRNNYLPVILRDFDRETIKNSQILILNAPTKTLNSGEVEFLAQYMQDGGVVILATGYDDKEASLPLLERFGFDIENLPLGPVPYVEEEPEKYQLDPKFVDSWNIVIEDETKTEKYYRFNVSGVEYVLMTFTKYGNGGLLLISDSMFLLDQNIESLYDYWPGNIQFLYSIIDQLRETGVLK